ncbi:MAG: acetyl-CoA carboxylase biotin carboxyl carrier protein subunit [Chloroflexi bacterium]|nr:acetyl-CoA carboxylase biotin carboxyl carrier protein subunit [Chloroflexota bacterium]
MKYYVDVAGRTFELDLQEDGERLRVQIGDQHLTLDLRAVTPPSLYSLLIDNRSYEIFVEARGSAYDLLINGELFHLTVQDEWTRRLANIQRKTRLETGEIAVTAPMPGAVVSVEVVPGQEVQPGQGLVILSAMKMENEIRAPRAGRVKSVEVQAGQSVEQGRTLIVLE